MTTATDNEGQTTAARGVCVLLCDPGETGGPVPPNSLLQALSSRRIRPLPVADPLLALAMLVRLERETAQTPMPVLFIACSEEPPTDDLLHAVKAYCPSAVSRRHTDSGHMVPLEPEPTHKTNGRTPPTPVPGRNPDLRLAGDPPEPKPATDVQEEDTADEDHATLTDEELSMLLSDDWHRRADGTQS